MNEQEVVIFQVRMKEIIEANQECLNAFIRGDLKEEFCQVIRDAITLQTRVLETSIRIHGDKTNGG